MSSPFCIDHLYAIVVDLGRLLHHPREHINREATADELHGELRRLTCTAPPRAPRERGSPPATAARDRAAS